MIHVPLKLRKNGYDYTQVIRGMRSCLYEQHVTPRIKQYEVFEIRIRPAEILKGKSYPERERFPGNSDFGKWAWSYTSFEKAKAKFDELEAGTERGDK